MGTLPTTWIPLQALQPDRSTPNDCMEKAGVGRIDYCASTMICTPGLQAQTPLKLVFEARL